MTVYDDSVRWYNRRPVRIGCGVIALVALLALIAFLIWGIPWIGRQINGGQAPAPTPQANNGGNGPAVKPLPNMTYYPELSCSHLASCQVTKVPDGFITIGFTNLAAGGCDWKLYKAGEEIDFSGLDEIHTYHGNLPYTKLEGFVNSQKMYIHSCQP